MRDVDGVKVKIFESCKGENGSNGCKLSCRGKCLIEIAARALAKALGNETSLVAFDGAICIALDLENPSATNGFSTRREIC